MHAILVLLFAVDLVRALLPPLVEPIPRGLHGPFGPLGANGTSAIVDNEPQIIVESPAVSADWPQFANQAALQQSPWAKYFMSLYGELPSSYPLRLSDFWCFYTDKMQAAGVSASAPASVGKCPTSVSAPEGQRYDQNNAFSSKDLTWVWHPLSSDIPYKGFPSNSIVEVSHHTDPVGDEHHGMWFFYAKGSNVFFELGNTKIFNEHADAFGFFGAKNNEDMCQKAAAKGYDSIQFIRHVDATNYPCAKRIGAPWMNMEIVAVKLTGTYACGQEKGTPASLRMGWNGHWPCSCDNKNPNTNCQGPPIPPGAIRYVGNTSKCLDLPGGNTKNGNKIWIWDCNGLDNQNWVFAYGSWQIKYKADTSKCIDVPGGVLTNGNVLQIWDCNGLNNQKWGYDGNMHTIYLASSADAAASKCMDLTGGKANDGTSVELWDCNGLVNQKWAVG